MKKTTKKLLAGAIAVTMALGTSAPALAEDFTSPGNETITVNYSKGETFTVTIPKNITLSDGQNASFEVTAKGDIPSQSKLNIHPESNTFQMTEGTDSVTATIDEKATISLDRNALLNDGTTTSDITITTESPLHSGEWSGTFTMVIEVAPGA